MFCLEKLLDYSWISSYKRGDESVFSCWEDERKQRGGGHIIPAPSESLAQRANISWKASEVGSVEKDELCCCLCNRIWGQEVRSDRFWTRWDMMRRRGQRDGKMRGRSEIWQTPRKPENRCVNSEYQTERREWAAGNLHGHTPACLPHPPLPPGTQLAPWRQMIPCNQEKTKTNSFYTFCPIEVRKEGFHGTRVKDKPSSNKRDKQTIIIIMMSETPL